METDRFVVGSDAPIGTKITFEPQNPGWPKQFKTTDGRCILQDGTLTSLGGQTFTGLFSKDQKIFGSQTKTKGNWYRSWYQRSSGKLTFWENVSGEQKLLGSKNGTAILQLWLVLDCPTDSNATPRGSEAASDNGKADLDYRKEDLPSRKAV